MFGNKKAPAQAEQEKQDMKHEYFRSVFTTHEGKVVLSIILDDLCFFRPTQTEKEHVLVEYAKHLVGYIAEGNAYDYVDAITGVTKPNKEAHNG